MQYIYFSLLVSVLVVSVCRADDQWGRGPAVQASSSSSSGDRHLDQLLPGEEVTTPSGKKMKVWTTRGPVPVSQAPAPFEDREKSVLNGSEVIVDESSAGRRSKVPPAVAAPRN